MEKRQHPVAIADDLWEKAKKAAEKNRPETTRPMWIEQAIREKLEKEIWSKE